MGLGDKLKGLFGDVRRFFGGKDDRPQLDLKERDARGVPRLLYKVFKNTFLDMQPWREDEAFAVKQYIGRAGKGGSKEPVPINEARRFARIYLRLLASGEPQSHVQAEYDDLDAWAETFRLVLNRELTETKTGRAVRQATAQSLFAPFGILKTALADGNPDSRFEYEGEWYDAGKGFTGSVDFDHFVIDLQPSSLDRVAYMGDRYEMPLHWIREMRRAGKEAGREALERGAERLSQSEMRPEERASGISEDGDQLYRQGWCWDIYLPKENIVVVYEDGVEDPLDAWEWDGAEGGPYDLIYYDHVPGEVMPTSPISSRMPLHLWINNIARKLEAQTDRQKTLPVYELGNEADAKAVKAAGDGVLTGLTSVQNITELKVGGHDPGLHNMLMYADQKFDQDDSLSMLGGNAPQSETATQESLLQRAASIQVDNMRQAVARAVNGVIRKRAFYVWTEPLRSYQAVKLVKGTGIRIPIELPPEVREGDFLDFNFTLNIHSLREETPEEQAQKEMLLWERLQQSGELLQQQGYMPNAEAYFRRLYELLDADFDDMVIPLNENMPAGGKPGREPMPSAFQHSETVNTRISRPGTTQAGNVQGFMDANSRIVAQGAGRPAAAG